MVREISPKDRFKMAFGYYRAMRFEDGKRSIKSCPRYLLDALDLCYPGGDPMRGRKSGRIMRMKRNKEMYGDANWPFLRGPVLYCRCSSVKIPQTN